MKINYEKNLVPGWKYTLTTDHKQRTRLRPFKDIVTEFITLRKDGYITLNKGYSWDGPSGPTIDTESFMRGSAVHDALYQLISMDLLSPYQREKADKQLRKDCIQDGMFRWRAWYVYHAVRTFGGLHV